MSFKYKKDNACVQIENQCICYKTDQVNINIYVFAINQYTNSYLTIYCQTIQKCSCMRRNSD